MLSVSPETTCSYETECSVMHGLNHLHAPRSSWLRSEAHKSWLFPSGLGREGRRGRETWQRGARPRGSRLRLAGSQAAATGSSSQPGCFSSPAFSLRHSPALQLKHGDRFPGCPRDFLGLA